LNILNDKEGQGKDRQDKLISDMAVLAESSLSAGKAKIDGRRLASFIILDKSPKGVEAVFETWDDKYLLTEIVTGINTNLKNYIQQMNKKLEADKVVITGEDKAQYFLRIKNFQIDEGKSHISTESI